MTWPGIEPRSPGPLANTLTIMPISSMNAHVRLALINHYYYSWWIFHTSIASPLLPSFLDIRSLSISSLECKVRVINFLVLWSICLSSYQVHFMILSILYEGTTVFISFLKFLLQRMVLRSFLILLRYSLHIFSFISAYLMMLVSNINRYF